MNQATLPGSFLRDSATFLIHFVNGGLVLGGLVTLAIVAMAYLHDEPMRFSDVGVPEAQAAASTMAPAVPVAPAPPVGRVQPAAPVATLSPEMQRVRDFVSRRYRVSTRALEPVLAAAESSGRKVGIDPLLIVAVMAIESSFNPFAESSMGAQGLMQVIPRFHLDKIGHDAGEDALFDPQLNVHVGTLVLSEGLRRFGSLQSALQYYGGALRDPSATYANKVLAMKQRLVTIAGREAATGV